MSNTDIKKRRLSGHWDDGVYTPPRLTKREKERDLKTYGEVSVSSHHHKALNEEVKRLEFNIKGHNIVTMTSPNGRTTILLDDDKVGTVERVEDVQQWILDNT